MIRINRWFLRSARRGPMSWAIGVAVFVFGAGSASADSESSPVSSDPIFKALMIDGRSPSGRIVSFDQDAITIATPEGKKEKLPLEQLVKLTREAAPTVTGWEESQAVLLPEGDRLMRTAIGSANDTSLEVRSESLGKLELPLDCILGLILSAPGQSGTFDARWDQILVEPRKTEVVWLINGDRLEGSFLGMDDRKIKVEIDQKPVEVERTGAVALGFDPALLELSPAQGSFPGAGLERRHAPRGHLSQARRGDGRGHRPGSGGPCTSPWENCSRVIVRSSSVVYLAERTPAKVVYASYVGPTRTYRTNRAVDGRPFQLAGQTYDRGIGTQSRTLMAYRIEPGDRRFQALVGVDERAGPLGSVVFRVLIDGTGTISVGSD